MGDGRGMDVNQLDGTKIGAENFMARKDWDGLLYGFCYLCIYGLEIWDFGKFVLLFEVVCWCCAGVL